MKIKLLDSLNVNSKKLNLLHECPNQSLDGKPSLTCQVNVSTQQFGKKRKKHQHPNLKCVLM